MIIAKVMLVINIEIITIIDNIAAPLNITLAYIAMPIKLAWLKENNDCEIGR